MPYTKIPNTNAQYALISFDEKGAERTGDIGATPGALFSAQVLADAKANPPTDIFLFSHGWKGDLISAVDQYNRWIGAMLNLPADVAKMGAGFRPLWIGLHWPSLPMGQEKFGTGGGSFSDVAGDPDSIKNEALKQFGDTPTIRKCLDVIFTEQENNAATLVMPQPVIDAYQTLAHEIGYKAEGPQGPPDADGKAFDPAAAFEAFGEAGDFSGVGDFFGKLLSPLAQLSYWQMKYRARSIGEGGMHAFVASLQQALPADKTKIHLIGHSFGCIVVSSILGGPNGKTPLPRQVDSLVLAQGALSLWAYGDHVKDADGKPGYYNAAFRQPAVRGPIVTTRSANDSAVGSFYPLASALVPIDAGQFGLDDDLTPANLPLFGGLGAFGIRSLKNVTDLKMLPSTVDYSFKPGVIYNLKGDEFIPDHNGIDNAAVAHALWQTAFWSKEGAGGQAATSGH